MLPEKLVERYPALNEWAILITYRGSVAHGMYIPPKEPTSVDDKDVLSVCVPTEDYFVGLKMFGNKGTKEIQENEWDIVVYEIRKFISLLEKGNPNVLSSLWLEPQYYMKVTQAGKLIIDNRGLFVSKKMYHAFRGYAYQQMHKMTHYGVFNGHMGEKRKRLVEKFGYDVKNAAHMIRLLRMCHEFLIDGRLYVHRPDASQLLEIKRGEWSLDKVMSIGEGLFKSCDMAYEASTLPKEPDYELINKLCVDVVNCTFEERKT